MCISVNEYLEIIVKRHRDFTGQREGKINDKGEKGYSIRQSVMLRVSLETSMPIL